MYLLAVLAVLAVMWIALDEAARRIPAGSHVGEGSAPRTSGVGVGGADEWICGYLLASRLLVIALGVLVSVAMVADVLRPTVAG